MYPFDAFPQVILEMVEGKSFMRCNFPIGATDRFWDPNQILEEHRGYTFKQWQKSWLAKTRPEFFTTSPPLPAWTNLRLKQVIPEEESGI